jgi:glycosyltransferase involved in cell wall biosynthesis
MRILLWYWGRKGGGAQFTLELARALAADPDVSLALSISRWGDLSSAFAALGVPCDQIDTYRTKAEFVARLPRVHAAAARLVRQARAFQADVVVSTMPHLWTPLAAEALRRACIKYVPIIHDAHPHPGDPSLLWGWRMRMDLNAAFAAITLTKAVAAVLRAEYPSLAVLSVPLGAHLPPHLLNSRPRSLSQDGVTILSFGRIARYKGLDLLRDAFQLLLQRREDVRLRIVGDGDPEKEAPGIARLPRVEIDNRWVAEEEIPDVFASAHVAVLTFREASQSGVLPIAHAFGLPVVATAVGGIPEQVRNGLDGILTSPHPEAIADALDYITRPEELARFKSAAMARSRSLTDWSQHRREFLNAIRALGVDACSNATHFLRPTS